MRPEIESAITDMALSGWSGIAVAIIGSLFALLKLYAYIRKDLSSSSADINSIEASTRVVVLLREELDKAKEELRQLREELDKATKEVYTLRNLRYENESLRSQLEALKKSG